MLAAGVTWPAPEQTEVYIDPKLAALVKLSNLQPKCSEVSLTLNTFQLAAVKHKLLTGQPYNTEAERLHTATHHKPQLANIPNHALRRCLRCETRIMQRNDCCSAEVAANGGFTACHAVPCQGFLNTS